MYVEKYVFRITELESNLNFLHSTDQFYPLPKFYKHLSNFSLHWLKEDTRVPWRVSPTSGLGFSHFLNLLTKYFSFPVSHAIYRVLNASITIRFQFQQVFTSHIKDRSDFQTNVKFQHINRLFREIRWILKTKKTFSNTSRIPIKFSNPCSSSSPKSRGKKLCSDPNSNISS